MILLLLPVQFNIYFLYRVDAIEFNISISYLFGLFSPEIYPFDKKKKTRGKNSIKEVYTRGLMDYIWDKISFEKLTWKTNMGFKNAYLAAVVYGSIWSIKSIVISLILANKEIDEVDIDVNVNFNEELLDILFNCIIKIRMVYIINIWIRIIKMFKGGGKSVRTSNRRAYAYNDEQFKGNG
ncbi:DUF2953 domain-containing protein [Clostridium sp. Cult3]|uniref:DUF2953 domain-containing protein n=1 Tax=Clostridium sp. Cult3 TaxID=2079004 RepID=UPI001F1A6230|nr:DUF2953 domain-containing protein [Clostridium sp. Cult3]